MDSTCIETMAKATDNLSTLLNKTSNNKWLTYDITKNSLKSIDNQSELTFKS